MARFGVPFTCQKIASSAGNGSSTFRTRQANWGPGIWQSSSRDVASLGDLLKARLPVERRTMPCALQRADRSDFLFVSRGTPRAAAIFETSASKSASDRIDPVLCRTSETTFLADRGGVFHFVSSRITSIAATTSQASAAIPTLMLATSIYKGRTRRRSAPALIHQLLTKFKSVGEVPECRARPAGAGRAIAHFRPVGDRLPRNFV